MNTPPVTTQQLYPWRATLRTILAVTISVLLTAGAVLPLVAVILQEELGDLIGERGMAIIWGAAGIMASISLALTRIMQIPKVDGWLDRLNLSSAPGVSAVQHQIGQ